MMKEIFSLKEIDRNISDVVVFLDVDDTIITPVSPCFYQNSKYKYFIDDIKKDRKNYPDFENILSTWRLSRKIRLIEEVWPDFVDDLKKRNLVYGLTKMETGSIGKIKSVEEWRYNELYSLGVVFVDKFLNNDRYEFTNIYEKTGNIAAFHKGVFFTGDMSKGHLIEEIHSKEKFTDIIVIDDKYDNLVDIQKSCAKLHVKCDLYLYKAATKIIGDIDEEYLQSKIKNLVNNFIWQD